MVLLLLLLSGPSCVRLRWEERGRPFRGDREREEWWWCGGGGGGGGGLPSEEGGEIKGRTIHSSCAGLCAAAAVAKEDEAEAGGEEGVQSRGWGRGERASPQPAAPLRRRRRQRDSPLLLGRPSERTTEDREGGGSTNTFSESDAPPPSL